MIKLFFLVFVYIVMVVQLITVLSLDFSKTPKYAGSDLATDLGFLLLLIAIVYLLGKRLVKEMLANQ